MSIIHTTWLTTPQLSLIIAAAFLSAAVHYGLGQHAYYLEAKAIERATELAILFEPFCVVALSLPKVAVALVLIQISPPNKRRALFLYCLVISQILSSIVAISLLFTQCAPVQALWTPALANIAECRSPSKLVGYTIFHGCL